MAAVSYHRWGIAAEVWEEERVPDIDSSPDSVLLAAAG